LRIIDFVEAEEYLSGGLTGFATA